MSTLIRLCAALALCTPTVLLAQWDPRPVGTIPRMADGAPDLDAPAPRSSDGKPDLSGVWQGYGILGGTAAGEQPDSAPDDPPVAGFANVADNMKEPLPLTPAAAALLDERRV